MPQALNITELVNVLGDYSRQHPGLFVDKVFNRLQTLDHVTVIELRDEMPITNIGGGNLLRPQKYDNAWDAGADKVKFQPRILKVRPGKFDLEMIPATLWKTWMGMNRKAGSADQHFLPFEEYIFNYLAGKVADEIQTMAIWKGVYNINGSTAADITDGIEKVVEDSITAAGEFDVPAAQAVDVGVINAANAYDQSMAVARALPDALRNKATKAFMSWQVADYYNDDYTATFGAAPFNNQFNKTNIHGTNTEIVRTTGMSPGKILVAGMDEIYVGMDTESDLNQLSFEKNHRAIDIMFDCQLGTQIKDLRNIAYGYDAP